MTVRYRWIVGSVAAALTVPLWLTSADSIRASAVRQASIAGRVEAGGALEGVSVTLSRERGGMLRETTTGSDGAYQFDNLPAGLYRLNFDLPNFDIVRRHGVSVVPDTSARVDVTMRISSTCECIELALPRGLRERVGTVVTEANEALPHARLEVEYSRTSESDYADRKGRFRVLVPIRQRWKLTASEPGFRSVTHSISGAESTPLIFRLPVSSSTSLPAVEGRKRPCRCAGDLFRDPARGS
jgi:hypothetical protein